MIALKENPTCYVNQTQCSDQAIGGTFVILFEKLHRWLIIYKEFNVTVNQPLLVNNILLFFVSYMMINKILSVEHNTKRTTSMLFNVTLG